MKRFFTLLLAFLLSLTALAQRPKVGVVLCGGGAKGASHVGVLKVLEENNIPIDYIVGTSMGGIVAGLYAIGYSASELDSLILVQDWDFLLSDRIPRSSRMFERKQNQDKFVLQIPFGSGDYSRLGPREPRKPDDPVALLNNIPLAVVNGQNIYNLFTQLSVGYQDSLDFSRMPIPFACVAVDVKNKEEVVFKSGNFVDAIRATMAIPGYFAPMRLGDRVFVDGGLLNNYPADVCKEMGADIIIGVVLKDDYSTTKDIDNIGSIKLIQLRTTPLDEPFNAALKRAFDIVVSLLGLIVLIWGTGLAGWWQETVHLLLYLFLPIIGFNRLYKAYKYQNFPRN